MTAHTRVNEFNNAEDPTRILLGKLCGRYVTCEPLASDLDDKP